MYDESSVSCVDAFGYAFVQYYGVNAAFQQLVNYFLHVGYSFDGS
jgi:hypothetical protein